MPQSGRPGRGDMLGDLDHDPGSQMKVLELGEEGLFFFFSFLLSAHRYIKEKLKYSCHSIKMKSIKKRKQISSTHTNERK